jgi:hypothetical protein
LSDKVTLQEAHGQKLAAPKLLKSPWPISRRDSRDFAEEIVAGLQLAGFAPVLDRHDIAAGEEWEPGLAASLRRQML